MPERKRPSPLLPEKRSPGLRFIKGGVYRSRTAMRLLLLLALISALFGGVGLDVCLSEPLWEKHVWLPSMLMALAVWLLSSFLIHALRMRLFGK